MPTPAPLPLPCPLSAGWEVVQQVVLKAELGGGFSAGTYRAPQDELWLLSDRPEGWISRWRQLKAAGLEGLQPLPPLRLIGPEAIDGEALVIRGQELWIGSEGRQHPPRAAELRRYDLASGSLQQVLPLPPAWQPGNGRGLRSNGGPESLTALPPQGDLLLAAEFPLQQDPTDRVRLLRWRPWQPGATPQEQQPLALPRGHWGLTDLLALPSGGLLGLWREFLPPVGWRGVLVLYPSPGSNPQARPLPPLQQWPLASLQLPSDDWEVLLQGPPLSDGRATLLLASDDNQNPLQASHLVRLAPRCGAALSASGPA